MNALATVLEIAEAKACPGKRAPIISPEIFLFFLCHDSTSCMLIPFSDRHSPYDPKMTATNPGNNFLLRFKSGRKQWMSLTQNPPGKKKKKKSRESH